MKKQLAQVAEFQETFGQVVNDKPTLITNELSELRYDLMKEENEEYLEACNAGDLVGIADALADELYILCGTILTHGMQHIIENCFNEVQRSNMSKLDDNGKPIINGANGVFDPSRAIGKILKPSTFSAPNLEQYIL